MQLDLHHTKKETVLKSVDDDKSMMEIIKNGNTKDDNSNIFDTLSEQDSIVSETDIDGSCNQMEVITKHGEKIAQNITSQNEEIIQDITDMNVLLNKLKSILMEVFNSKFQHPALCSTRNTTLPCYDYDVNEHRTHPARSKFKKNKMA